MRILALVEDLRINKTSAGIRSSIIIKSLLDNKHELKCIYDYSDSEVFPWLKSNLVSFERIEVTKESKYIKLLKKIPKISALVCYLTGFNFHEKSKIKSWETAIKNEYLKCKYDFIFVLGAGNSNYNFFAISRLKLKIPYIVNYHDPYPIQQYPEPYKAKPSIIGRLKASHSNKVMKNAHRVSFPSQRLYEWMLQFHPVLKNKSFVIPHIFLKLENLHRKENDEKVFLDTTQFNLLHVGSLLGPRKPTHLLNAFLRFVNEDVERKEKARLNIIGSVTRENITFDKGINSDAINIIKERISYLRSVELMKEASVLIVLEAIATNSPFMPGKLADYFSVDKVILALTTKKSETSRLLGENYPYITEMDNEDKIYNLLVILWNKWRVNTLNNNIENLKHLKEYVSSENFNKTLVSKLNL